MHNRNEPPHNKTNKMACAPSEDSDQPGNPPSLIRVFTVRSAVAKDPSFLHTDGEDSDQTGRMPRLICVFAGRTCHFVGLAMRRLILGISRRVDGHGKLYMSQLMRLWHLSSSVNSIFNHAYAAIQWSHMSDFWSDPSSTSILYVCEQRRLWRDCADAHSRMSLRCSPMRYVPLSHELPQIRHINKVG